MEFLAGNRIRGTTAEKATLVPAVTGTGGWKEVGRTTLGSSSSTITVSSLANKRYYMALLHNSGQTGSNDGLLRVGNGSVDTGSNYSRRISDSGGTDNTAINQTSAMFGVHPGGTTPLLSTMYISNLASQEKLMIGHTVSQDSSGSGENPKRSEQVNKWANTSAVIDTIQAFLPTQTYNANSELVVLGWDEDDTHTTNFWEELASVDWASGDTISSGTITAKKYLWVQINWQNTTSHYANLYFNADANGTNYASRQSLNGASDATNSPHSSGDPLYRVVGEGGGGTYLNNYLNMFIINNSANEKLIIAKGIQITTTGAGNAPDLRNEAVGKWANTSEQITNITLKKTSGQGNFSGGTMKVWGSN